MFDERFKIYFFPPKNQLKTTMKNISNPILSNLEQNEGEIILHGISYMKGKKYFSLNYNTI